MLRIALLIVFIFSVVTPQPVQAFHKDKEEIEISIFNQKNSFKIQTKNAAGGVSLAVADLGNDGIPEIIVGNGLDSEPRVRILRQDGSEIGSFLAYTETLSVGINVTTCDLDGNGTNEIITAPQRGGGPHVRVFDGFGNAIGSGVFAYNEAFRGGINLACGDINGDGQAELVTLPSAGGGPHVRIWNLDDRILELKKEFFAFDTSDRTGLVGTIDNKKLFVSQQHANTPIIKTFSFNNDVKIENEKQISINSTGVASIVIHNQKLFITSTSNSILYNADTNEQTKIYDSAQSFVIASANLDNANENELIIAPSKPMFDEKNKTRIVVDISEQRLYAYRDGILENSFLISSGKNNSTPLGIHQILAKIPKVHYKWSYGPNDPRNYDLGLVPYNLRFAPHIYLHYAYWHNNFGHPMSRGCVNISLNDMKWLYDWARVGIEVEVKE
ncbi:L,D-transpeptidase family protein [Candidatus Uhrbacteria bacterium]|nr:L,D-transpeptidase family protein [Candidatus Uhrbacteria bacterium]